jgi:UDP-galactopyranose mutase
MAGKRDIIEGFVIRQENAYPFYSIGYEKSVALIRDYLSQFRNFQTIGRAGLFRYDNSDQALLSGIRAAENFLGKPHSDLWDHRASADYHES